MKTPAEHSTSFASVCSQKIIIFMYYFEGGSVCKKSITFCTTLKMMKMMIDPLGLSI